MYQQVLIPLDGSVIAEQALAEIRRVPLDRRMVRIVLLSVVTSDVAVMAGMSGANVGLARMGIAELSASSVVVAAEEAVAYDYLEGAQATLLRDGFANVVCLVRVGHPATRITEVAEEAGCDLIMMGSKGTAGIRRVLFGSVTDYVVRNSPKAAVLVVNADCGAD